MDIGIILLVILAGVAIYIIGIYNGIIKTKNSVEETKSAIDTVFQNRYDLIPNLVEVVKQYASYEKGVLEKVTELRSAAMSNTAMTKEKIETENMLSGTLKSLFALSENYPDLKANQSFIALQNQWTEIEERMQAARRGYNASVKALNDKKQMFPSSIIAGMMNLAQYAMFEADEQAKDSLSAKELFNN